MRAPFKEILPERRGLSILTRDVAAIAACGCIRLRGGARVAGFRLRGLALLRHLSGALLFHLRNVEEILPAEQHEPGKNDGEDGVAIVGHRSGLVIL
jgi:hypothetical protein